MRNIRQADFDAPIGSLELRDGTELPISRYDLGTFELAQEIAGDPNNLFLTRQLLRRILRTASDEQLSTINEAALATLVARARLGIDEAEALLGESSGATTTSLSPDSPPEPTADLSATASPPHTG